MTSIYVYIDTRTHASTDASMRVETGGHDLACTVDVVEPVEGSNDLYLRFADDNPSQQTLIATVSGMRNVSTANHVVTSISPGAVHLFDNRNGAALKTGHLSTSTALKLPDLLAVCR